VPAPVTADQLPAFRAARPVPPGRRLLTGVLARPSSAALVGLLVGVLVFGLTAPGLLSAPGISAVLDTAATVGIGGVGVALLLIAGQFDFSVGAVALGSSLITALLTGYRGWAIWPALLVSLLAAVVVGLVNGLLVVGTGAPSFLTTLAVFLVVTGGTLIGAERVVHGSTVAGLSRSPGWASAAAVFGSSLQVGGGRFHVAILWCVVGTLVASWALWRTRFGNGVFAIGGARRAARELGVPVGWSTVGLFCGTAAAGWLIGTLGLVRSGTLVVTTDLGPEIGFLVVAVVGGCLLTGGYGSPVGAALAAVLYGVADEGIQLAGWSPLWFEVLLGVLLLVALLANGVVRRRLKAAPRS
jgi:simple sugar transport system permease protein